MPSVTKLFIHKEKQEVVLCLVQINIHTYISNIYLCVYIYYLFVWGYSFEGLAPSSVLFLNDKYNFHGASIEFFVLTWLPKPAFPNIKLKLKRTTSLFLFVIKQLCYSRQNKYFSIKIFSCRKKKLICQLRKLFNI